MFERTVKLVISIVYYGLQKVRAKIISILGTRRLGTSVVLTYHSVKASQVNKFASQMDELRRLGMPVFADFNSASIDGKHQIAVTFDDGFKSVVDNALPVMIERRIPATIFVTTGYLGRRPEWIINPKHHNFSETVLSKEQIEKLPFDLVCIGSHCVNHRNLSHLDLSETMVELQQSKRVLEDMLGKPVHLLSLPYGGCNDEVVSLARKAGYEYVFTNVPVFNASSHEGYVIGRIHVSPEDWRLEFKLKALGAYQWLALAIAIKRRLMRLCGFTLSSKGNEI